MTSSSCGQSIKVALYWGGEVVSDFDSVRYSCCARMIVKMHVSLKYAQLLEMLQAKMGISNGVMITVSCRYPYAFQGNLTRYIEVKIEDDESLYEFLSVPQRVAQKVDIIVLEMFIMTEQLKRNVRLEFTPVTVHPDKTEDGPSSTNANFGYGESRIEEPSYAPAAGFSPVSNKGLDSCNPNIGSSDAVYAVNNKPTGPFHDGVGNRIFNSKEDPSSNEDEDHPFRHEVSEESEAKHIGIVPSGVHFSVKRPSTSSRMSSIRRCFKRGSDIIISLSKSLHIPFLCDRRRKECGSSRREVFDPQGPFVQRWNKIFVLACVISLFLDPFFFYIPVIDNQRKCLDLDRTLKISTCVLRSITDLFYIYYIYLQFCTGIIAPSSRVFGKGELIEDLAIIAKKYFSSYFIIDFLAVLPLPQIVLLTVTPTADHPISLVTKQWLKIVVFAQYVPRTFRIYPLYNKIMRSAGLFTETAWAGAAFNLFLYTLAGNVVGAFWYLIAVERQDRCWRLACQGRKNCVLDNLYCGQRGIGNSQFLNSSCPLLQPEDIKEAADFDFGIFLDALQSRVVESRNFWFKLFYCFWWGLQNISSLGQNLKTSNFLGEILFAIVISIVGLIWFSLLIGNVQKYLQSITVRVEEMRLKKQDAEQWMSHRMLPVDLRERIRRFKRYQWQETRGLEEDSLLRDLPRDLRRDIKRHLCLSLVKRVPLFEQMDEQLLDAMCDRLKPALYTEGSFIIRELDPVKEMLFLLKGNLLTITTNGGRTGFFNSVHLKPGDFCGEGLLTWALEPNISSSLPASTRTVKALTDIVAFTLTADDLKFIASQFRRLHNKQLRHTFRFYSQQWRTWAACFIQAAWRRHRRNKLKKLLQEEEDRLQAVFAKETGSLPSFGATAYASRFTANALRNPLILEKPDEPDFRS